MLKNEKEMKNGFLFSLGRLWLEMLAMLPTACGLAYCVCVCVCVHVGEFVC